MMTSMSQRFAKRYQNQKIFFRAIDVLLYPLMFFSSNTKLADPPKKILIANSGHLGDLVIATAAIASVREKWPEAQIDMLCASSMRHLQGHLVGITQFHYLDHWFTNRSTISFARKFFQYFNQGRMVLKQIRAEHYSLAIDLRMWFPNFIPFLWLTGIPIRVGSDRVGFSPLLTHVAPYKFADKHESEFQIDVLNALSKTYGGFTSSHAVLLLPSLEQHQHIDDIFQVKGYNIKNSYSIVHIGSSNPVRDWPIDHWRQLAIRLTENGEVLVFTGAGKREQDAIEKIIADLPACINFCDALSLSELIALIKNAKLVYSVETAIGHIAGALRVPVVSIYGATANPSQWKPLGDDVALVTKALPCAPCFKQKGCQSMDCIRSITVSKVLEESHNLLHASSLQNTQNDLL